MMKTWLIVLCVLGGLCPATESAVMLLCPAVKGDNMAEYKKAVALAKSIKIDRKGLDTQDKAGQTPLMLAAELDNRLAVAYLVAQGADTMRTDKAGKTALDYAVSAPVRELLSVCRESNKTVLHEDKQKQLREMGIEDPAERMKRVKTLIQANKIKELAEVLKLGVELDAKDTPDLHRTSHTSPEVLALLIRRGYNVNTPGEDAKVHLPTTPGAAKLALALGMKACEDDAFITALLKDDVGKAKSLMEATPALATGSCGGMSWSPLCLVQSADMVQALKDAGADATHGAPTKEGERKGQLLHEVIANRTAGAHEAEVVQALVEAGAVVADTPHILSVLCSAGSADAATARALIQAGAKADEADENGDTALHYAAARGRVDVVKVLLGHKANPNAVDADGYTPILFLLKNNAKLNPSGAGLPETLKALIKGGANPKAKTKDGQNALQLAKSLSREDLAKVIKSAASK